MKTSFTFLFLALVAVSLVALAGGCGLPTANKDGAGPNAKSKTEPKDDTTSLAIELLRHSPELAQCKDALQLLNHYLELPSIRAQLHLAEDVRQFMAKEVGLSNEEIEELQAGAFRAIDAHYVEECFLFRDVTQYLDAETLPPVERARAAFRWVTRHVHLHEQGDHRLPASFTLRQGHGGLLERSLVFLALMRQFGSDGGIAVIPGEDPRILWTGLLEPGTGKIFWFDPRDGELLTGKDSSPITSQELLSDSKRFDALKVSADAGKNVEFRLALPLESMSTRMLQLEKVSDNHRVYLYRNAQKTLAQAKESIPVPVKVWNDPSAPKSGVSLVRLYRQFLPPEDGGTDSTGRYKLFTSRLAPWAHTLLRLSEVGLNQELAEPARDMLLHLSSELFQKYAIQPSEFLSRGQLEKVFNRMGRIRPFLEDDSLVGLSDNPRFQKEVARLREAMNKECLSLVGAPKAQVQAKLSQFWGQDVFFIVLLQVNDAENPERYRDKIGILTRVMAHANRDYLQERNAWFNATVWHEKALRAQPTKKRDSKFDPARKAWNNAKGEWTKYQGNHPLTSAALNQRLASIRQKLRGSQGDLFLGLQSLEWLHRDLHTSLEARRHWAEAVENTDGKASARKILQNLVADLDEILKTCNAKSDVDAFHSRMAAIPQLAQFAPSIKLLTKDWVEGGHLETLRQQFARQAETLAK